MLLISLFLAFSPFCEEPIAPWGVDAEFTKEEVIVLHAEKSAGQKVCKGCIRFFQNVISPIDGPRSSYYPSSSQYALEAIEKYGVFTGIALGCDRLMRENKDPWVYQFVDKYGSVRKLDAVR